MNANAKKLYRAEYASAGCLPDDARAWSHVAYFSSRADAEEFVKGMTADDDTEADGNLYTWSICELSDAEVRAYLWGCRSSICELSDTEVLDLFAERFDEMLDECHEPIEICGLTYAPSMVLKNVNPVAYRCALLDYAGELV